MDEGIKILDLVYSDTFCEILAFLRLEDLFNLRCVSVDLRDYIDKEFRRLKKIQLPTHPAIRPSIIEMFRVLCENCFNLETIIINRNEWLTDALLLPMLTKNAQTLVTLKLNECAKLTAVVLQPVIIGCAKLRKLGLQRCNWLTVGCLEAIAFHQNILEELDLSHCENISERCLIVLLNNFRNLRVVSLASVLNVSDNVLFAISKCQTEIVHLNLFSCIRISDRGIGALSLNCKKLESLSIRACPNVRDRSLELLRSRNVHIDIPRIESNALLNQYQILNRINIVNLQV